ncbi:restriction endonuclease, partial [Acinetobacter baumannii]
EVGMEFKEPSADFVRLFASRVYEGRVTQQVLEKFTVLTDKALRQFLNERINDRLKSALGADVKTVMPVHDDAEEEVKEEAQVEEVSDG